MGIFDTIKHAIFGDHGPLGSFNKDKPAAAPAPTPGAAASHAPAAPAPTPAPAAQQQAVDVEAILAAKAQAYGKPNNWRTSIVDLLKMLGLDSSLSARKELAEELGVHAGDHGSAEQNMALQKAVWRKLADNGGKVPASLRD